MVESRREVSPMVDFFEKRKDDFVSLEVDERSETVVGEHKTILPQNRDFETQRLRGKKRGHVHD